MRDGQTRRVLCALDPGDPRTANAAMLIYKIFRAEEWAGMQAKGHSAGSPADRADGFVHFSTGAQLPGTLARHFAGEDGLVLLACDSAIMGEALRWEPARDGALFPHLYRPLRLTEITWTRPVGLGPEGHLTGPLE